jgi:protocatechuate 3,4-dioxygenase beta subunit
MAGRSSLPTPVQPKRATTDGDGQFEFTGLPAGTYRISASPPQYSSQYLSISYGATRSSGFYWNEPGKSIELKDGQTVDKVLISLPRGGVITGRVVDENGEPLTRVQVYTLAFPPGTSRGVRYGGGGSTDDLGQFRLWGMNTGEYVVVAEARNNTMYPPSMGPETEEERTGFVTTYYPGAVDEGAAQRLRVKAGEETSGIEIRVGQARMYHITGNVVDSQGRPVTTGNGQLMRRGPSASASMPFFAGTDAKGHFDMRNVPPGDYRLVFRLPQANVPFSPDRPREPVEMAIVPLSIVGADVDNLLVVTSLGVNLTGRVVFEQGPPTSTGAPMRVMAVALNMNDSAGIPSPDPAIVAADGTFTLKGLMGEYGLRTAVPNQYMKSVTVNGEDITDLAHEFKASDRVTITMTSRVSTIEGDVTDLRDTPLPEVGIILFSEDKASWRINSVWTKRGMLDAKGHFRVVGILPGRYYMAALPRQRLTLSPGSDADTAFFEQLAKEATGVVVGTDEQRTVDLPLLDAFARQ